MKGQKYPVGRTTGPTVAINISHSFAFYIGTIVATILSQYKIHSSNDVQCTSVQYKIVTLLQHCDHNVTT